MTEMESKTKRQEHSIEVWRMAKGLGTLNLVPRFGKTRIAKIISEKLIAKYPTASILAIAPNDITCKNLIKNLPSKVICVTRNQIMNNFNDYSKREYLLVIIDEVHRFLDEKGILLLEFNAKYKLGLTGDRLSMFNKSMLKLRGFPVIDTITEDEAIRNNWISPSVEYNLGVEIEDYKRDMYVACSDRIKEIISNYKDLYKRMNTVFGTKLFNSDIDLMYALYGGIKYTPHGKISSINIPPQAVRGELAETMGWNKDLDLSVDLNARVNEYFNPSVLQETARMFSDIVRERNDLIINSKNKISAVLDILTKNPVPSIIFNESTNMATLIAEAIGDEAIEYHSSMKSRYIKNPDTGEYFCHANGNPIKFGLQRLKAFAIAGIKTGLFKYICTAKALNEGVDIPILSQVITTGGTINPSTHLQRVARGKTLYEGDPEKVTTIINIYIKSFDYNGETYVSRDYSKLSARQKDSQVIWVDSIDEIFADME